jgi:hypothetical protein
VGIYNESGELVKEILVAQRAEPLLNFTLGPDNVITTLRGDGSTITIYDGNNPVGSWDGTTQAGGLASNGSYYLKVDSVDNMGVAKSTTQPVMVSRSLLKTTVLIYNEAGEVIKHLYSFMDDPGAPGVASVQFSANLIEPGPNPGPGVPSQLTLTLSSGTTLIWDGTTDKGTYAMSGQYLVEVHTVDGQGGETTISKQLSLLASHAGDGVGIVTAWPNVLKAGSMVTTFHSDSALSLTLEGSLYTVAGELARKFVGVAGTNSAPLDLSDLASGVYIAEVRLLNVTGGQVGRQFVKVIVLR